MHLNLLKPSIDISHNKQPSQISPVGNVATQEDGGQTYLGFLPWFDFPWFSCLGWGFKEQVGNAATKEDGGQTYLGFLPWFDFSVWVEASRNKVGNVATQEDGGKLT